MSVDNGSGLTARIGAVMLAGSAGVHGSLQTLLPGDTAIVKADGPTDLAPEVGSVLASGSPAQVRALLILAGRTRGWAPLFFANAHLRRSCFDERRDPTEAALRFKLAVSGTVKGSSKQVIVFCVW